MGNFAPKRKNTLLKKIYYRKQKCIVESISVGFTV